MTNTCRLCLHSDSEKCYPMDTGGYQEKMQSILPEMDFQLVEGPCICKKCSDLLLSAYSFKINCLQREEELKMYAKDNRKPIRLEEFLRQKNEFRGVKMEDTDSECDNGDVQKDNFNVEDDNIDISDAEEVKQNHVGNTEFINCDEATTISQPKKEKSPRKDHKLPNKSTISTTTPKEKPKFVVNKCGTCNKIFLRNRGLEAHLRTYGHERTPQNDATLPEIKSKQKTGPLKINHDTVNKCPKCHKVFFRKDTFDHHVKCHKMYECTFCDHSSPSKTALDEHIRTHTGERPYKCNQCDMAFAQSSTLSTHVRSIHMTERPYVCEVCGLGFPVRGAYTAHMKRLHQPVEKKFVCNVCGKAFRVNSMLSQHVKRHTGEKNYLCQVCSKAFVCNTSLRKHMRIHTGKRPFECPICQKTFTQNYNMKVHLKSCSRNHTEMGNV